MNGVERLAVVSKILFDTRLLELKRENEALKLKLFWDWATLLGSQMKWTLRHIVACAVLVSAISATATHVQDAVENVDNHVTTAEIGGATSYKGTCQSFESWPQTDSSADGLRFTEVSIEIDKKGEIQVFHVNHPQWSELAPHPTYISVKCTG